MVEGVGAYSAWGRGAWGGGPAMRLVWGPAYLVKIVGGKGGCSGAPCNGGGEGKSGERETAMATICSSKVSMTS